ncbi:pyridoxamine 5'-phosphate oxidase family protein [Rhodococcus opacus]|uniref:pyridoxamine 5'-phosphate oxidase family protein n=1 Tax=Rhodococcus opacus TaxID=37919 RepID=UPI0024B896AF|nr:pyridoxamine 5'-phosphate oxidase family protein [Rhodococcus opacus]MDJ0419690.1 pyridoxamine 5'-phosphate oxidase family protein [Rhodococcus opacus]
MTTTARDSALSLADCRRLLRSVSVGWMVFTENALPALRPVTLAAVADEVVIPADGVWWERFDGEFLAFEADLSAGNGWSVVVMGRATHLSFTNSIAWFHGRATVPWSIQPCTGHLVIDIKRVTGRHVTLRAVDVE